jgi:hypothetical protein
VEVAALESWSSLLRHQRVQMLIMATQQENLTLFLLFAKLGSATAMERSFRARYKKPPLRRTNIYRWYKKMEQVGCISTACTCCRIKSHVEKDNDFVNRPTFSDESTFHLTEKVNRHNVRMWGTETPHSSLNMKGLRPK